jgi:hypothetical protein
MMESPKVKALLTLMKDYAGDRHSRASLARLRRSCAELGLSSEETELLEAHLDYREPGGEVYPQFLEAP